MSYTLNRREAREVTFDVGWINEPITITSIKDAPMAAVGKAGQGEFGDLLDWMPADLSVVLWEATVDEFTEFMDAWSVASDKRANNDKAMISTFERMASLLFEPQERTTNADD